MLSRSEYPRFNCPCQTSSLKSFGSPYARSNILPGRKIKNTTLVLIGNVVNASTNTKTKSLSAWKQASEFSDRLLTVDYPGTTAISSATNISSLLHCEPLSLAQPCN